MFQFPGFPLSGLCIHPEVTGHDSRRVSPFGYLRISVCLRLPVAFRSWPRPSSAYGALASALCSSLLHSLILRPCHFSGYLAFTFYLLDWLSRKTHFQCAVVKIRLAFRSPLLASGRTLKTIQRAETTSFASSASLLSFRLDRP